MPELNFLEEMLVKGAIASEADDLKESFLKHAEPENGLPLTSEVKAVLGEIFDGYVTAIQENLNKIDMDNPIGSAAQVGKEHLSIDENMNDLVNDIMESSGIDFGKVTSQTSDDATPEQMSIITEAVLKGVEGMKKDFEEQPQKQQELEEQQRLEEQTNSESQINLETEQLAQQERNLEEQELAQREVEQQEIEQQELAQQEQDQQLQQEQDAALANDTSMATSAPNLLAVTNVITTPSSDSLAGIVPLGAGVAMVHGEDIADKSSIEAGGEPVGEYFDGAANETAALDRIQQAQDMQNAMANAPAPTDPNISNPIGGMSAPAAPTAPV